MKLLGLVFQAKYKLSRHVFLGIPMNIWLISILAGGAIACQLLGRPVCSAALSILAAADVIIGFWAKKSGFVKFSPSNENLDLPDEPLGADVELFVQAFGCFRVRSDVRYLAHHPIIYSTSKSREHILMAQFEQKRFLLVGISPEEDWGCWYQFIKPEEIDRIEPGTIYHGLQPRFGLLIKHRFENDEEKYEQVETILAFDSLLERSLVWEDLNREFHK
jgi:hypothetical protein